MSRERRRARPYLPSAHVVLAEAGVIAIAMGIGIVAQIGAFYYHSSTAGRDLVGRERREIARAAVSSLVCQPPLGAAGGVVRRSVALSSGALSSGAVASGAEGARAERSAGQGPHGLLEVPALGMVAPVVQGTGDSVLRDAVGHDPASVWPGQAGTSVLSAHDVTWFSRIGQLKPGNEIRYVTPCRTYAYKVTSHVIVAAGAPVKNTRNARLVLDTCWPLDALFLTSTRYLVFADLIISAPTHATAAVPGSWPPPAVPAPARLAAQGLDLAHNPAPLGTLRLTGSPSRAWRQSSAPLQFEVAALAEYFGIVRSATQEKRAWWEELAPRVPARAAGAMWGGRLGSYDSKLRITLRVAGTTPVRATLTAMVTVTGPNRGGSYKLTVTETVSAGRLLVTRARLTPVGE
jgi:LPXTG-site transpeptidase (sortase) family protein